METTSSSGTWDDAKWQRYGLLAGIVFVLLNLISFFAAGVPPARDASAEKIGKYFADNAGGIKLGAILFGFALIFGLWWLGSLWRVISRLEPSGPRLALIAAAGFVMSGALAGVSQALFAAPALRTETLGGTAEFVWSVGYVTYSLVMATTAAHMLALAALVIWTRFLPVWTGWLALVSAAASAAAVVGAGSESGAFVVLQMIGFISWLLWVLVASALLSRRATA
jgi:hypothetical protein